MAFLKFVRDRRGYENFSLLEPTVRGQSRARLLYWFRTPPNVKVGRTPFDPDVRRALETQNPGVIFDWTAITQTPIPPADAERWRERRRVERAMRSASEAESGGDEVEPIQEAAVPERPVELETAPLIIETTVEPLTVLQVEPEAKTTADPETASNVEIAGGGGPTHRRRRRRRGRRKPQAPGSNVPGSGFEVLQVTDSTGSGTAQNGGPADDSEAPEDDENLEP